MVSNLVYVAFLVCVWGFVASWKLRRVPETIKNEPSGSVNKMIWKSNQNQFAENNMDKGKTRFWANILRGGAARRSPGHGHVIDCSPVPHTFTMTWEPLMPNTTDNVEVKFNMVAMKDFYGGILDLEARIFDIQVWYKKTALCKSVRDFGLKCPFIKGQNISFSYTIEHKKPWLSMPYQVELDLYDERLDWVMCGVAYVQVVNY
ncbi:uncharacterized protein LOC121388923 [Gigantopelta aegis]|uniref:uncharacterized protein LOC121388923 n=1 Tax=Gigantopelta aegis TaxID=1735272 RepID=UPI001B88B93A|nr:uncharacterized protein LOC121388923 [Gigantopelta aegis]XP_041376403.1 uncharacterized protein LOC121388923 [Gigantopelta aegis]